MFHFFKYYYRQNILEWSLMPTDWSILESNWVTKLKTRFNGNPRHVEMINELEKTSNEITEHLSASSLTSNDEYLEGGEEQRENTKKLESVIFNDVLLMSGVDESMEMVQSIV